MDLTNRINDSHRTAALRRTGLLDSGDERAFDRICKRAAQELETKSAFVSIIAADRHYLKSSYGEGPVGVESFERNLSLDLSFSKYAIASGEPFIVEDSREHPLVRDNVAVKMGVIAFAGVPFRVDQEVVGTICVIDSKPRRWTRRDIEKLRELGGELEILSANPAGANPSERDLVWGFLQVVEQHLKAANEYRVIIETGEPDSDAEYEASNRVVATAQALRLEFTEKSSMLGTSMDNLVVDLRQYLGAEERRRKAADQFVTGQGKLDDLRSAIAELTHTQDKLRLRALDLGLSL